jgi:hypothetical protein
LILGLIQSGGEVMGRKIFNMGYDKRWKRNPLRKKRDNSIIKEFFLIKGKNKRISRVIVMTKSQNEKSSRPEPNLRKVSKELPSKVFRRTSFEQNEKFN